MTRKTEVDTGIRRNAIQKTNDDTNPISFASIVKALIVSAASRDLLSAKHAERLIQLLGLRHE